MENVIAVVPDAVDVVDGLCEAAGVEAALVVLHELLEAVLVELFVFHVKVLVLLVEAKGKLFPCSMVGLFLWVADIVKGQVNHLNQIVINAVAQGIVVIRKKLLKLKSLPVWTTLWKLD